MVRMQLQNGDSFLRLAPPHFSQFNDTQELFRRVPECSRWPLAHLYRRVPLIIPYDTAGETLQTGEHTIPRTTTKEATDPTDWQDLTDHTITFALIKNLRNQNLKPELFHTRRLYDSY